MAGLSIRHLTTTERHLAHLAVRCIYSNNLAWYFRRCLRELLAEARVKCPEIFTETPLDQVLPVDRTIYAFLTTEGRRTIEDLISETGLPRRTVKASLTRLQRAKLIDALEQGATSTGRGQARLIWVSLAEQ